MMTAEDDAYADADLSVLQDMAAPRRPWQLELSGDLPALPTDKHTDALLIRLFEYRPDLHALTIRTENGDVLVRRTFPSDKADTVDALIVSFFALMPQATGLVLHGEKAHVATPDAPYASRFGKEIATIRRALEAGEISAEEARGRLSALTSSTSDQG